MAVRPLLQAGDPRLKAKNKAIDSFSTQILANLLEDLVDTMRAADLVGIAASQIGENYDVFLTEPRETAYRSVDQSDQLRIFINPQLVHASSDEVEMYEGCGSVSAIEIFGPVKRPREVTIEAWDEKGTHFRLTCDGILARIIQHECDHLEGIEFTSKISDQARVLNREKYIEYRKSATNLREVSKITKKEYQKI